MRQPLFLFLGLGLVACDAPLDGGGGSGADGSTDTSGDTGPGQTANASGPTTGSAQGTGATNAATATGSTSTGIVDPQLVQAANVTRIGSFSAPSVDGTGRPNSQDSLDYGGFAIGMGPDGQSLYYGCHDWHSQLARITIPALGDTASIVETCKPVPNLDAIGPAGAKSLGGTLVHGGQLTVAAYVYYDAGGTAGASHFWGSSVDALSGPARVGTDRVGMVAGYMGRIPSAWQASFGGPALTGQCCIPIISRTSFGPSVSVFDPATLGSGATPSQMLVGYPAEHPDLGDWAQANPLYAGADQVVGVAFPPGTRSVLFIGRHATTYCYGIGTDDPALDGMPNGEGGVYCYDPTNSSKGTHGYPYEVRIWAYDANELVAVKAGQKQPWDARPYATFPLPGYDVGSEVRSATYDPATRRIYLATPRLQVDVFEIDNAVVE